MLDTLHHDARDTATALRNVRAMHFLERIAVAFNRAGIDLMLLKGAALHLTLYHEPDQRPMTDLDIMVRPNDAERAVRLLQELGCRHGEPLVREDFFPRFYYEREFNAGVIHAVRIDLHVRPFRPLRYARLMPHDAFWANAESVRLGESTVLVPCREEMLIHLAVHSAVHGNQREIWRNDIAQWLQRYGDEVSWEAFLQTVMDWRLSLPVLSGLETSLREAPKELQCGTGVSPVQHRRDAGATLTQADVMRALQAAHVSWRDRMVLRQAPRDRGSPLAHLLVDALCTPGWRFVLSYLAAVLIPSREHMADWYGRRHSGWLLTAHMLRLAAPLLKKRWLQPVETRPSAIHGVGVFATCDLSAGTTIAAYQGKPVETCGLYVGFARPEADRLQHYELTGKLKFLNHSCRPNAKLGGFELKALRPILAGQEVTIDYGPHACSCRRHRIEPSAAVNLNRPALAWR